MFGSFQNRGLLQLLIQLYLIHLKLANDTCKHLNVDMRDKLNSGKHVKGFNYTCAFGDLSTCMYDYHKFSLFHTIKVKTTHAEVAK